MSDKLKDAVKELRERYGDIPLSNAIIKLIDHDIYLEETNKYLRERLYEARDSAIDLDKKYSNCLIRIRELNNEIDRLKTERDLYKSSFSYNSTISKCMANRARVQNIINLRKELEDE